MCMCLSMKNKINTLSLLIYFCSYPDVIACECKCLKSAKLIITSRKKNIVARCGMISFYTTYFFFNLFMRSDMRFCTADLVANVWRNNNNNKNVMNFSLPSCFHRFENFHWNDWICLGSSLHFRHFFSVTIHAKSYTVLYERANEWMNKYIFYGNNEHETLLAFFFCVIYYYYGCCCCCGGVATL